MNLDRAQVDWTLGRFSDEDLPELAAQMMMQGHEGPAILELASFHMPNHPQIPADLVDDAFRETGRSPLPLKEAVLRHVERLVQDCLQEQLSAADLGEQVRDLSWNLEDRWTSPLSVMLSWQLEWEEAMTTANRRQAELEFLKAAGAFLKSRTSEPRP